MKRSGYTYYQGILYFSKFVNEYVHAWVRSDDDATIAMPYENEGKARQRLNTLLRGSCVKVAFDKMYVYLHK